MTFTQDQWVIQSISKGVWVSFNKIPFQSVSQSNMQMSTELWAICDQEVKSLLSVVLSSLKSGLSRLIKPIIAIYSAYLFRNQFDVTSLSNRVVLIPDWRCKLSWWVSNLKNINGETILAQLPDMAIYSDASTSA